MTEANLAMISDSLRKLSRATHLRELESGSGVTELPGHVQLIYRRLVDGDEVEIAPGEHLYAGDRLAVRATNQSIETRYVTVIDIGLTGSVTILTAAQPSGTTMAPGEEVVVGENAAHRIEGVEMYWPDRLPKGGPRPESLITLVADEPIDNLPALEQEGVASRSAKRGGEQSAIELLIEDVAVGTRDVRPMAGPLKRTRYRVHRPDVLLHPTTRPADDDEPTFEIDERPDPSFRLVVPRAATDAPGQVSIRLSDLVVHSNRSFLKSQVRVDFLVVTAAGNDAGAPYRAETWVVDRVRDGDRLPFGTPLVYDGPVHRFLDIAVWVSRGDSDDRRLTDLLSTALGDAEAAGAVTTLAALAVAAPPTAVVAATMAAVGTLLRTSADLIRSVVGDSIGVYRSSFLPHEGFGAGQPARRHPEAGLIRAQDMSLAFEVVGATTRDATD